MDRIADAAVLGAGIAGASMAKALADRGWETVLIDRRQFPRHKVCGEFLSPESDLALRAFGLRDAVESLHPSPIGWTRLYAANASPLDIPLPGIGRGVSRYALDAAIQREAQRAGVQVHTGMTVTKVVPEGNRYRIETLSGSEKRLFRARAVIAAWGANPRAGLPGYRDSRSASCSYIGVKSHYTGLDAEPAVELYFFPGGYLGLAPVEDGRVNVAALLERKWVQSVEQSVIGLIEAAVRLHPQLGQRLASAVPVPGTQAAVAPVRLSRKPAAWKTIPHAGDAALMIPPLCGDGMSMALRSAQMCVDYADRFLRGEISLSQWQHGYEREMMREFRRPLRWGRLIHKLIGIPGIPALLIGAGHLAPALAYAAVRATRLKETGL